MTAVFTREELPADSFVPKHKAERNLQFADAGSTTLGDLVDLARYPIDAPDSPAFGELIERVQADLAQDGCSILPGFLTSEGLQKARREGRELAPKAFYQELMCNIYNTAPDPSLPEDDARNLFFERSSGFVTRDVIPADMAIHRLYVSPAMKRLVSLCTGEREVYEYADPFAGLVFNVLPPGTQQPWHYDGNEFVTTVLLQEPEEGGEFEYCPSIRQPGHENLEGVARVVRGDDTEPVRRLKLRPGDLQLFKGRYSLHQVTRVGGQRARHSAVFGYAKKPGVVGPTERTRQLYGRVSEAHILAERKASHDGLIR